MRTCDYLIPEPEENTEPGIASRVGEAIHRWICNGGRTPTRLYLGDCESEEMKRLIDEHRHGFPFGSGMLGGGLVFMGLRVYRVLEPEHLQVC